MEDGPSSTNFFRGVLQAIRGSKETKEEVDYDQLIEEAGLEYHEWSDYFLNCRKIPRWRYAEMLSKRFKVRTEDIVREAEKCKTKLISVSTDHKK